MNVEEDEFMRETTQHRLLVSGRQALVNAKVQTGLQKSDSVQKIKQPVIICSSFLTHTQLKTTQRECI